MIEFLKSLPDNEVIHDSRFSNPWTPANYPALLTRVDEDAVFGLAEVCAQGSCRR